MGSGCWEQQGCPARRRDVAIGSTVVSYDGGRGYPSRCREKPHPVFRLDMLTGSVVGWRGSWLAWAGMRGVVTDTRCLTGCSPFVSLRGNLDQGVVLLP